MALNKKGDWRHAATAADLDQFLLRHVLGKHCRGVPHRVAHARCAACGAGKFDLFTDDGERVQRVCTACQSEYWVCNLERCCFLKPAPQVNFSVSGAHVR